jgi:hypothetical protein
MAGSGLRVSPSWFRVSEFKGDDDEYRRKNTQGNSETGFFSDVPCRLMPLSNLPGLFWPLT